MASAANPTLLNRFLTFINPPLRAGLAVSTTGFDPLAGTLLAVSGGLDSVVMTHLFQNAGLPFAIAHVNFGLRGSASDEDARFVEQLAHGFGVPLYVTRFATDQFAARQGVSIQMAARTLRYDWFEQIRGQNDYQAIATAHHRNDVLETLLLNLTRGTGLAGLHGIAFRQGKLIRPLLFADRAELEAYARTEQLTWREDESNGHDRYARNRIRHQVVPVLQSLNPGLLATLDTTLERLRAAETLVQHELDRTAGIVIDTAGAVTQIDLILLRTLAEPAFRLAHCLRPFGFTYQQTTAVWQAIGQGSGQEFGSATHRLIHQRGRLTLVPIGVKSGGAASPFALPIRMAGMPESVVSISETQQLMFRYVDKTADFSPVADPRIASFDADRLPFPLTVRRWERGDLFRPLGLNGQKLVSDLLADQKVPRLEREQVRVLLAGDRIVWVIGRRTDHHCRIRPQTRRILQVQLIAG